MSQETIRALEHVRQRLNNLASQLSALRRDLEMNEGLPSWPSIQNSASLLSNNLTSLHETLSRAQPLFTSAHVYPLPSFPGRTHEDLLTQLLRKKLQPPVEDWIEEGVEHGSAIKGGQVNGATVNGADGEDQHGLTGSQLEDLWNFAGPEGNRVAREMGDDAFADVFTLAEQEDGIENVVTGLRRKFWESDDEDDDGGKKPEPEKMDVDVPDTRPAMVKSMDRAGIESGRPMLPLEATLRFVSSGKAP